MKKSNLMKFLVISLIFVISFGTISAYPMSAKAAVDEEIAQANKMLQDFYNISEKEAEQLFNEIEKAKVFYKFDSNGTVFFDAKSALKSNVSPSLVSEISLSMENAGEEKLREISQAANNCKGLSLFDPNSSRVYADSCQTDDFIISLIVVGSLAAIVGLVAALWSPPVGAAYGIAGVIIGAGAAVIGVKHKGCGIFIYWEGPNKGVHAQTIACGN